MKQRSRIAMTPVEVAGFLAAHRKMQLATVGRDGTPHLTTMFYALVDGRIAFWTYAKSQKARNLDRDQRLTCLVEDGESYLELRGVQLNGVAEPCTDVLGVGRLIASGMPELPADARDEYVAHTARKRVAFVVEPTRISSWDHTKLLLS